MQGRNLKSFVVHAFEIDSKRVRTEVDEKFHVCDDRPVYNASQMVPQ